MAFPPHKIGGLRISIKGIDTITQKNSHESEVYAKLKLRVQRTSYP